MSTEEIRQRLTWFKDEQSRTNSAIESRVKSLEAESHDLRNRIAVLTRLIISRQIATAEEIATALASMSAPSEVDSGRAE